MTMPTAARRAFVCLRPQSAPAYRIICVPYAGGGAAAYRALTQGLSPEVEAWGVRLAGRETRLAEPPLTDIRSVVDTLIDEMTRDPGLALGNTPFALFGHSMGALVCFELARSLRRRGLPMPVRLFVSGRRAPAVPDEQPLLYRLPAGDFLDAVQRLGGIPRGIFADPEMVDLILPALRADFAVCETYQHHAEPPLPCGISAFGGRSDPTTTAAQLEGWRDECDGEFTSRYYDGDHFFVHAHQDEIAQDISRDLAAIHGEGRHG